jgi:hypothetical protein
MRISRPPSVASTIPYDALGSVPPPSYYPNDDNYENEDRPWMSTPESRAEYVELQTLFKTLCGTRAYFKGWDRIRIKPIPAGTCKTCGQRIKNRHKHGEELYVLGDDEYAIVDNVLSRLSSEMRLASDFYCRQRHLSNAYHILVGNKLLLHHGLKVIISRKFKVVTEMIRSLFNGTVPESDVQTQ